MIIYSCIKQARGVTSLDAVDHEGMDQCEGRIQEDAQARQGNWARLKNSITWTSNYLYSHLRKTIPNLFLPPCPFNLVPPPNSSPKHPPSAAKPLTSQSPMPASTCASLKLAVQVCGSRLRQLLGRRPHYRHWFSNYTRFWWYTVHITGS